MSASPTASQPYFWREGFAYWFCQFAGWAFFMGAPVITIINDWHSSNRRYDLVGILLLYLSGIGLTHIMHLAIQAFDWKSLPTRKLILRLSVFTLLISFIWCSIYGWTAPGGSMPWRAVLPLNQWLMLMLTYRQATNFEFAFFHWLVMSFVVGVWAVLYFSAVNWKEKQSAEAETWRLKAALATAELAALHAQTNPHFLFNALNSLRGLISENPDRAQDAITRLATILRYSLQLRKVELVSLEQELQVVDDYLELEGLRFEDRLRISREIDPATRDLLIPPMTMQTLVENAIKYGVSKYPGPNHLSIRTKQTKGTLEIEITNEGDLEDSSTSTGIGIKNTTDRLRALLGTSSTILLTSPVAGRICATVVTPSRSRLSPP